MERDEINELVRSEFSRQIGGETEKQQNTDDSTDTGKDDE